MSHGTPPPAAKPAATADASHPSHPRKAWIAIPGGSSWIFAILVLAAVGLIARGILAYSANKRAERAALDAALQIKEIKVFVDGKEGVFTGPAPFTVTFAAIIIPKDPAERHWTYLWDFGDGTLHDTEVPPVHVYERAGTYTIRLTVTGVTKGWKRDGTTAVTVTGLSSGSTAKTERSLGEEILAGASNWSRGGLSAAKPKAERPSGEIIQARIEPGVPLWTGTISVGKPSPWFEVEKWMSLYVDTDDKGAQDLERFQGGDRFYRITERVSREPLPAVIFGEEANPEK